MNRKLQVQVGRAPKSTVNSIFLLLNLDIPVIFELILDIAGSLEKVSFTFR